MKQDAVVRDLVATDEWYADKVDAGVRYPVRVLHAHGIETAQSCQGGAGHAYHEPTIDLPAQGSDALGFAALAALRDNGVDVLDVALVWSVVGGLPHQKLWRVQLRATYEARVDDRPLFTHGYWAT